MIYALVDMGSNTIRLNVYKCEGNDPKLLFGTKSNAGLIGYIKNGVLTQKGIRKACSVLNEFKSLLSNFEIDKLIVFATASLRNIDNTEDVLAAIEEKTGIKVDLISGEEEAIFDFVGATKVVDVTDGLLVDIGGGSTELVAFENGRILHALSIPIGSLSLYNRCVSQLLPDKKERKKMKDVIMSELENIENIGIKPYKIVCGVGGSIRAAGKLNNSIFELPDNNKEIKVSNIKKILKLLASDSRESIETILQVVPDRIHTIIPGMIILNVIAKHYNSESITVSNNGVREGYLYSKVLKERDNNG
ncbi:MAG: phosphatase [Eubacteriaceae bacterium]|nr:phosphatase [Eubacteriaceae bacterium]